MVIDKYRNPKWRHENIAAVRDIDVAQMLMPLGEDELKLEESP